jgi:hypothetical protein
MARTDILRGPCKITFNSKTFYSKANVQVDYIEELIPINVSRMGSTPASHSVASVMARITFEPDGRLVSNALSTILPFNAKVPGASVFGADTTLTINTVDGYQYVFTAAANTTKSQVVRLGIKETLFGPMEFTAIYGVGKSPTDSDALYTRSEVSYPGDTGFAISDIVKQAYDLEWDGKSAPWDAFASRNDITLKIDTTLSQDTNQSHGIFDFVFEGMQVSATFEPDGPTIDDALDEAKLQGSGAALGRAITSNGADLNISGTGLYIRLYNAALINPKERHSAKDRRLGEVEFRASRGVDTGTMTPLIYVGASAPA